jgi:hypothetical protein
VLLRPVVSTGLIVHSNVSRPRNVDALFVMLGWDRFRFYNKRARTRYAKLVFLHSVGSAGHIVDSYASELQNVDALFDMLRWDRYGFRKKCARIYYVELVFCIRWDLWVT